MAIAQPWPGRPSICPASTSAPSKNTSANSRVPLAVTIARQSIPCVRMGTRKTEMPRWRCEPGSERASSRHQSAHTASLVQIFWPKMR